MSLQEQMSKLSVLLTITDTENCHQLTILCKRILALMFYQVYANPQLALLKLFTCSLKFPNVTDFFNIMGVIS